MLTKEFIIFWSWKNHYISPDKIIIIGYRKYWLLCIIGFVVKCVNLIIYDSFSFCHIMRWLNILTDFGFIVNIFFLLVIRRLLWNMLILYWLKTVRSLQIVNIYGNSTCIITCTWYMEIHQYISWQHYFIYENLLVLIYIYDVSGNSPFTISNKFPHSPPPPF